MRNGTEIGKGRAAKKIMEWGRADWASKRNAVGDRLREGEVSTG